jgi:protease-4
VGDVEREPSAWERFLLSFGDSSAMTKLARRVGFTLPSAWLDRGEMAEIGGILETLKGKRYAAFAHCFCDFR